MGTGFQPEGDTYFDDKNTGAYITFSILKTRCFTVYIYTHFIKLLTVKNELRLVAHTVLVFLYRYVNKSN